MCRIDEKAYVNPTTSIPRSEANKKRYLIPIKSAIGPERMMPKGIAIEVIKRMIEKTRPIASGGIANWMIVLSIVCRIGTPKNPIRLPTNITQNC